VSNEILRVENLEITYPTPEGGSKKVIRGIDLAISEGETVGLVGKSGSGKSVLAWSIMGLVRHPGHIERGKILYRGENLLEMKEEELRILRGNDISLIVSNPKVHLNPLETVGSQLARVIKAHKKVSKDKVQEQALHLLTIVGIPDPKRRLRAYPDELSGGMAQRVIIAMALANNPRLLIADDPTSGLDVTIQIQVLDLMKDLIRTNRLATLLATQDLGIVAHYCHRVAVLHEGKIIEFSEVDEYFRNPRHEFSRTLLEATTYGRGFEFQTSENIIDENSATPISPKNVANEYGE
jgi:ABC-type dipeptide/oligopeptide/nickel transport system ATPase component